MSEIDTFSAKTFQSIMNLKLKFWGYDEKNMSLPLHFKNITSGWTQGDENAMGTP